MTPKKSFFSNDPADDEDDEPDEKDIIIETEETIFDEFRSGYKKVLIFGTEDLVINNMVRQLKKEGHYVSVVRQPLKVKPAVDKVEPDLVLLQLKGYGGRTIDKILYSLRAFIRRKAATMGGKTAQIYIIVYRVEEKLGSVSVVQEDIEDTRRALAECLQYGNIDYIGLYNAVSFLRHINKYLKQPDKEKGEE